MGDVMIGIIVAEEKELNAVKDIMESIEEINIYEKIFYNGLIENKNVVVVKSNVGKVNSARSCQILIDKFNPNLIINVGTAGSVDNCLEIGNVIVANTLVQYDFDVTPFGRKLGEIENIGESIKEKEELLNLFDGMDVTIGCIASGDKFIVDIDEKNNIRNIFNALCVEMEGASIAQVCYLDNVPFLVIRSITDKLDGSSKVDFEEFLELSSKKATNILREILKKI